MSEKTEEFLERLAPCIEKDDLEACVEEASKLAEEMGIGEEVLLGLSGEFGEEGRHDFAYILALAVAPILRDGQQASAYNIAGLAALLLGDHEKSEDYFKKAIELKPEFAQAHYNYAILLARMNEHDKAEKQFQLTIELDCNFALAHYDYANILSELGRRGEAEKQYQLAIEKDPGYAPAYNNFGNLLVKLGRLDEAEKQFQLAIEKDHKYSSSI